ncbi:MAG: methyltransferase domain-containing protein [Lautropia sp.]
MIRWFSTRAALARHLAVIGPMAKAAQELAYAHRGQTGWCAACRRIAAFKLLGPTDEWTSLRECLVCTCGMNGRSRMLINVFEDEPPTGRFLMFERVTPFFGVVQQRYPFVEGCEFFGADVPSGETRRLGDIDVRHENMLGLSFDDASIDYLFHGDVLEHLPDIDRALAECRRVLKPGGTMLFTCPVVNVDRHNVRCRVVDGRLQHVLPPAYHGNPMDASGSLVFTEPSWQMLDDLARAGFASVEVGLLLDPFQGILRDGNPYDDYNMWPVFFRARKS